MYRRGTSLRLHRPGEAERDLPVLAEGLRVVGCPEWSPGGDLIYFCGRAADGAQGLYQVAAEGGVPRLLVSFDDGMTHFTVTVGNGLFYFSMTELESDIYVAEMVSRGRKQGEQGVAPERAGSQESR
jgi:hypothetical protein